jgi:hypothetical protein
LLVAAHSVVGGGGLAEGSEALSGGRRGSGSVGPGGAGYLFSVFGMLRFLFAWAQWIGRLVFFLGSPEYARSGFVRARLRQP